MRMRAPLIQALTGAAAAAAAGASQNHREWIWVWITYGCWAITRKAFIQRHTGRYSVPAETHFPGSNPIARAHASPAFILPVLVPVPTIKEMILARSRSDHARLVSCTCGLRRSTVDSISALHNGH